MMRRTIGVFGEGGTGGPPMEMARVRVWQKIILKTGRTAWQKIMV